MGLIKLKRLVIFSKKLCVGSVPDCVKTLINRIPRSAPLACCNKRRARRHAQDATGQTSKVIRCAYMLKSCMAIRLFIIIIRRSVILRVFLETLAAGRRNVMFGAHTGVPQLEERSSLNENSPRTCSCCSNSIDPLYNSSRSSEYFLWPRYL